MKGYLIFGILPDGKNTYLTGNEQGTTSAEALNSFLTIHSRYIDQHVMFFVHPVSKYGTVMNGDSKEPSLFTAKKSGLEIKAVVP